MTSRSDWGSASRLRPSPEIEVSLCSTLDGRAKSSFVEELNQRNERRSRMPIGGTGGVVVGEQSLIRPRGKGVSPRDDDSADAIVVMGSTTQCANAEQHVSLNVPINYQVGPCESIDHRTRSFSSPCIKQLPSHRISALGSTRNAEPSFHCEMRVSFCKPFSTLRYVNRASAASSFDRRTSFKQRQPRDSPSFRM